MRRLVDLLVDISDGLTGHFHFMSKFLYLRLMEVNFVCAILELTSTFVSDVLRDAA